MKVYVAYHKRSIEVSRSSSGGVFPVMAENIIQNGGVVFGVKFDENFNGVYGFAETTDEMQKFRGSKYVYSNLGDSAKHVADFLINGQMVLFSGTPCHCAKIVNYLDKRGIPLNNLLIVDIICHGAPQPKYWQKYLSEIQAKSKSTIKNVCFRFKTDGSKASPSILRIEFKNGKIIEESQRTNVFYRAFLGDYILMKFCHNCKFKGFGRKWSDITIADAWGVRKFAPGFSNIKGNSEIFIRNQKAQLFFDEIKHNFVFKEIPEQKHELMVQCNKSMVNSAHKKNNYDKFHEDLKKFSFHKTVARNTKGPNLYKRARFKVERFMVRCMNFLKN